ncbi:Sensor histidine kinase desK [Nocardia otitidiscaviarum]|uniref:histidine kinase n=1 Tax=Nocardia otitidiscaviarum TaxID=1823 RepID=A0A379JJ67_9NOCA|nr:histidine kinase [Nocardia otitidiscaviarum]SUD48617.1 Sensor histidine kinase desK [Nocardia otitidiscaviarum]
MRLAYRERVIDVREWPGLSAAVRLLPLAVVPLLLLASTFPGEFRVPPHYWLLAMTAAAVFAAGERWPLTASIVLSALAIPLFVSTAWGLSSWVPYLGALAVVDVVRRTDRALETAVAVGGWSVAVIVGLAVDHAPFWRMASAVAAGAYIGLPLLSGLYLRGQRQLAASLRARAAEAETRRAAAEHHARTAERSAMARELHDVIAHHMASIVLRIGVARHVVRADDRLGAVLDDVHDTAAAALADSRRLLVALRDPALGQVALVEPEAVAAELDAAVERVRAAGFTVTAEIAVPPGLDAIGRLTLLRLVQESLTNVMKHAPAASPVSVSVLRSGDAVAVTVRSAGTGAATGDSGDGQGIVGMRERVALTGGTLSAGPDGAGWTVSALLPIAAAAVPR